VKHVPTQAETIADLAARCEVPDQFDRGVRASLSVSKEAVLKAEARDKRSRARRRAKKPPARITQAVASFAIYGTRRAR
jgi:hypothetical protein